LQTPVLEKKNLTFWTLSIVVVLHTKRFWSQWRWTTHSKGPTC